MNNKFYIAHDIPGRLRLIVPALSGRKDLKYIMQLFTAVHGVNYVRIEPRIHSILFEYEKQVIDRNTILKHVTVFFNQIAFSPIDDIMVNVKPKVRRNLFSSLLTGAILFIAYARKTSSPRPDVLDYTAMISTAYTVLTHGGTNKLKHPDVIAGIVSMLSLGPSNILQASAISWGVNLLEILFDMSKEDAKLPAIT
ncbi:hypothetical protein BHU72_06430 [Desulfuribacillus stibiiarsenatis]|uniref:Uncharacterized protein n=1 Tax=Desulfuribacillus stibiiarsenatis TaxID=1390249 RepID=A0A1E5L549_9FIRM|nr:hypothetical protein [Desulfuribacillus stibiiarsenatis]OEH85236.1 hypothetical protein BHU72_06430 [Desulfuribacillus stibiiarsenatis]